jgi:transcriptional regulator with XRE-family HTH domain
METTDEATTAGEVVRARREELGLTKTELARRAHVTRSSIHEIELGQRAHLQERTVRRLEEALELPPGELQRRAPHLVLGSRSTREALIHDSLRHELESALSERRYESLLEAIMRVADAVDVLETRLGRN